MPQGRQAGKQDSKLDHQTHQTTWSSLGAEKSKATTVAQGSPDKNKTLSVGGWQGSQGGMLKIHMGGLRDDSVDKNTGFASLET